MTIKKNNPYNHQRKIVNALYHLNRFLSEINDLDKLLILVMEESKKVMDAEASSLMLYDNNRGDLYFEVALGDKANEIIEMRFPLGVGIAGAAAKQRKTIVVEDCYKDPRFHKKADETSHFLTKNLIAIPLIRQNRLIGVLEVINKKPCSGKKFTKTDIQILKFFSHQAAIAIENAQLVKANLAAERLAAIGQTITGISHCIKNILTSTMGSADIIKKAINTHNYDLLQKNWPVLERGNTIVWNLIQNMLYFSKDYKPDLTINNLNQLAKEIYQLCEQNAKEKQILFELDLDQTINVSFFDSNRLRDAILNLVNNAFDACQGKSGAKVNLVTKLNTSRKFFELLVIDNGMGIPVDIQKKIFDPFYSTKGSKGTGLGLAIARKIIEEHKGSIDFQSEAGRGTTFLITLPHLKPTIVSK